MTTEIDIVNRAFDKIGVAHISNLFSSLKLVSETTEDTDAARLARRSYYSLRDAVFESVAWRFADRRVKLHATGEAPPWGTNEKVFRFNEADSVGPNRTGYNLVGNEYWKGETVFTSGRNRKTTLSVRLNKLDTAAVLLDYKELLAVKVSTAGAVTVYDYQADTSTSVATLVMTTGKIYSLELAWDGSGNWTTKITDSAGTAYTASGTHSLVWGNGDRIRAGGDINGNAINGFIYDISIYLDDAKHSFISVGDADGTKAVDSIGTEDLTRVSVNPNDAPVGQWRNMLQDVIGNVYRVYRMPDFITPLNQADWRQEGNTIVARTVDTAYAMATAIIADPDSWSALFTEAVVTRLAMEWAMPATRDYNLSQYMAAEYAAKILEAKATDGQLGRDETVISSRLNLSRQGGGLFYR